MPPRDQEEQKEDGDDDAQLLLLPFAVAALGDNQDDAKVTARTPLAMRHCGRRRRAAADVDARSSSPSPSSSDSDDSQERSTACLSRRQHAEAAAALSLPVGAWPHFGLLQRRLRECEEERQQKRQQEERQPPSTTIPLGTLAAIHAQEAQHRASRLHPQHRTAVPALAQRYWPWGTAGGGGGATPSPQADVIELASAADMPPCLLVRRLAEHLLRAPKGAVAEALRDPTGRAMRRLAERAAAAGVVGGGGGATTTTPDHIISTYHALADGLQRDAARAAVADRCYSPAADAARALAGHEGEAALAAALRRAGVPFWTESDLRARGLFKTPDAWLQAPAAVRVRRGWKRSGGGGRRALLANDNNANRNAAPSSSTNDLSSSDAEEDCDWRVVHWIDSKALFGDARSHSQHLEGQYRQYADRYGPGMVVYWAGFCSGLEGATWPGWRDDLERDRREEEEEGEEGEEGAAAAAPGSTTQQPPPPWLVVVMDRFPGPEDVRLLPRVRPLAAQVTTAGDDDKT